MERAVHNRATIRVADRTDVSGRVTADEVNLDRFHNRIRKVCALVAARPKVYLSAATMILIVTLAVPATAQQQVHFRGFIQGNETDTPLQGGTIIQDKGSTTGIATYFGQFSFYYDGTANTATGMGVGGGSGLITANQDSISAKSVAGQFELTSTPGVGSVTEIYTITGGTGRFVGAQGSFTVKRFLMLGTGTGPFLTTGSIHGTITSAGADKESDDE